MRMNSALKLLGLALSMAAFGCQLPSDQDDKKSKRSASNSQGASEDSSKAQTTEVSAEEIESSLALRGYWLGIGNISLQAGLSIGINAGIGGSGAPQPSNNSTTVINNIINTPGGTTTTTTGGTTTTTGGTTTTTGGTTTTSVINGSSRITSKMVIRLIDGDSLPVINGQMTVVRLDATGTTRQHTVRNPNSNVYTLVLAAGQNYQLLAQGNGFSSTAKNLFFDSTQPVSVEFDIKVYRSGTAGDCLVGNSTTNGIIDLTTANPYPDCATPIPSTTVIPDSTTVNTGWKMRHCEDAINGTIDYPQTLLNRLLQSTLFQSSMASRISSQGLTLQACHFDASRYVALLDFVNTSGSVVRVSVQIAGQFDDLLYRDPAVSTDPAVIPADLVSSKLKFCDVRSGDTVADMNGLRLLLLSSVPSEAYGMSDLTNLFNTGHSLVDCMSSYPNVTLYLAESKSTVATKKVVLTGAYQYLQAYLISGLSTTTSVTWP